MNMSLDDDNRSISMRSEADIINQIIDVAVNEPYDAVVELWHKASSSVAGYCRYAYPQKTETSILQFIKKLKNSHKR